MSTASSVGQRFSQLIQALGMSKNAFAISLDKTATVIQHLVDERNKPGFDLMNKVVDVYPNVSIEWLLRGKGPMMLTEPSEPSPPSPAPTVEAVPPAARLPVAPTAPKAAPATPGFPAPLFAVSPTRPAAPEAATPVLVASAPVTPPELEAAAPVTGTAASPSAAEPVAASVPLEPLPALSTVAAAAPVLPPPALDAAALTAALHAQYLQHQLALAEQRNQHLLEQQKLILERQALMQQMLDLMRRPI